MPKKKTQKEVVVQRLLDVGYIDNFYSIDTKISIRLGAIICNLKKEGWIFKGGFIEGTKNYKYVVIHAPENKLF